MRTTVACLSCALAVAWCGFSSQAAETEAQPRPSPVVKAADAIIVRPISVASLAVGSVLFAISLPVTAAIKKVKPMADALVVKPARATFKRPLGDMDAMAD